MTPVDPPADLTGLLKRIAQERSGLRSLPQDVLDQDEELTRLVSSSAPERRP